MASTLGTPEYAGSGGARLDAPRALLSRIRSSQRNRAIALSACASLGGLALGALVSAATPLYVVAALLGLTVVALVIADSRLGLLLLIGVVTLLPFGVVPVPLGSVKLTFLDVTLVLLLIVWFARLLLRPDGRLVTTGVEPLVLLFAGIAVGAFLLGTDTTSETTRLFLKWINSVLLFFTAVNGIQSPRTARLVVRAVILGGAGSALIGLGLYTVPTATARGLLAALGPLGYPTSGDILRYLPSTTTMRAISTSVDPNVFGAMLMLAGVLSVSQLLARRPVMPRGATVACLAPILAALLLSYSRGSWIGLFAGCLAIALLRYRRPWVLIALALSVALMALLPGLDGFFAHLESGLNAQDQASAMRLGEYKDAFRLIQQYPVFGVGFGAAPEIDLYVGVSSIYLLLAEQMGLLGLAAFGGVVGTVLVRAVRIAARSDSTGVDAILIGSIAAMVAALVAGVLDHHFVNIRFPHMTALFWLVSALCVVSAQMAMRESAGEEDEASGS